MSEYLWLSSKSNSRRNLEKYELFWRWSIENCSWSCNLNVNVIKLKTFLVKFRHVKLLEFEKLQGCRRWLPNDFVGRIELRSILILLSLDSGDFVDRRNSLDSTSPSSAWQLVDSEVLSSKCQVRVFVFCSSKKLRVIGSNARFAFDPLHGNAIEISREMGLLVRTRHLINYLVAPEGVSNDEIPRDGPTSAKTRV